MPKAKPKFTCAAHWIIRAELWLGRGWSHSHQIGRCRFWNPRKGNHRKGEHGKCMQYPEVRCPYNGWRDFTVLQDQSEGKVNRQYKNSFEEEAIGVL